LQNLQSPRVVNLAEIEPDLLVTDDVYFCTHPRIYIGRLNGSVKRKELLELFARYGEIVDILMKDDFAFIEYIKPQSAHQAIKEMNGKTMGSVRIVVEEARPRQEEGKSKVC